ncbi:unnamed protein product [Symbiodinium necroappetens]|uniref:Reverse transcriptase Ty1/copia-type domain-containing protein n=1 Tax=Symbiodinium necroappetens TaxID=1628268 RepID=A0A812UME2_9DINO|nr:unnamed protein product [Symbiodinium necroappetens]
MVSVYRVTVNPDPGSGMAPKVSSEARSSEDAGVLEASAPLLKRPKTSEGSTDEAPAAELKPDVIDVEMFEDPSIPYEQFQDEEMLPGYFEEVPKLSSVVNAVLIDKNAAFPEQMKVCGSKVWLAKMKSALSELDGCPLDVLSAMDGRRTELLSMDSHKAGRIVSADEAHSFAKKHGIRIIPTRWVLGPKVVNGKGAVRARCVVQDVAMGSTASSLGLSATTPSLEALRTLLAIAAKESMDIATLDVSTAFLHSPLPKGEKAVIMLPRDVSSSSEGYVPVYMILDQAMNGLRVAAKAWNLKLANVVKKVGLTQCPTEPSVFEGTVKGKRFLMLCYVDGLILCGSPEAIKLVTDTLNGELKIKETGRITPNGGKIVFLGREIERVGEHLRMRVPPQYMESLFETDFCKDLKVLSSPPDIVKIIEKGRAEPEKDGLLTEAAAMRYRAVLGRIAWWGQSRPDLARWMSILSQGPSRIDIYADASWAPQAELRAILTAVQESEGIATLIGQLANAKVELVLHTDSSSAKAVLLNRGLSRRVRHLDIAVCYLQERIQEVPAGQNQDVAAPFWCKTCKWLFKNEGAHGLNKTPEGFSCGKCKSEITVMGSAAQHAFNMREKDKSKRWGSKGEGKGPTSEKAPITPAHQSEGEVPITPAPRASDLRDQKGTPEWYNDMLDAECRKGKPYRELVDKFERFISLLNEEGMTKYGQDYTSLKHQNRDLFTACEEAGSFAALEKMIMVIDLRGQFGGQAALGK